MIFFRTSATIVLVAAFGWCLALLTIFLFGYRDEADQSDAIVVLGAAQYDGRPSPVLKARLDHALELYEAGYARKLILTGGVGVGDTVSEAEVSQRYVVRHGVPAGDVLLERSGLSTDASMRAVSVLMAQNRLSSAILVSDPFHMFRLRLLALGLGIRGHSSPTRSSPIDPESREGWRHVFRETFILPTLLLGERAAAVDASRARIIKAPS